MGQVVLLSQQGGSAGALSTAALISALVTLLRANLVLSLLLKQGQLLESMRAAERRHGPGPPYQTLVLTVPEPGSPRSGHRPSRCVARTLLELRWLFSCCVTHGGKQREDTLSPKSITLGTYSQYMNFGEAQSIQQLFRTHCRFTKPAVCSGS